MAIALQAFNRGIISKLGLARTDLERSRLSAEIQTNFMPRLLGSMMLRPGTEDLGSTLDDEKAKHLPFIFSLSDTAIIELTDGYLRVRVDEEIITRPSVATTITNGSFAGNITGWTDNSDVGGTAAWYAGTLALTGTRFVYGRAYQLVTCSTLNTVHALAIEIANGPVVLKVGSTLLGEEYVAAATLSTGHHSIAFTPTGNFYVQFENIADYRATVESVAIESAGDMKVVTPWAEDDLPNIRFESSADVTWVTCAGIKPRRIERRANDSWSVVEYSPVDGPFRLLNVTTTTLTPSAINGDITVTASEALFKSTHVGALFSINSVGQVVTATVTAEDQFTDPIAITGVGAERNFVVTISGTWTATVTVQRSAGAPGAWVDYTSYTSNGAATINDSLDNSLIYYRVGVKTGDYTSGTVSLSMQSVSGSIYGVVKVTGYTSKTVVSARVVKALGSTDPSYDWREGQWSDYRGWPSSVCLYEGRLFLAGSDKINGSVSDAFDSFDDTIEGDSGPIARSIGSGPVETIEWLLPMQRLLMGAQMSEPSCRSSSFDEPLTPTNFNIKTASTIGSEPIQAIKIDSRGIFVSQGGHKVYLLSYDLGTNDYQAIDLSVIAGELFDPSIVAIAIQRKPDTRLHCIFDDGTAAIMIFDPLEDVHCWVKYETDGIVEDVLIMPGDLEDKVYYTVQRGDYRRFERWALESECRGRDGVCKLADCHILYDGLPTNTLFGLDVHEGKDVVVWADGRDRGTYTVSGGQITVTDPFTTAVAGLGYTATYKTAKLAYAVGGTGLNQRKKVSALGLVLADVHAQGLEYGPDFDHMDNLPMMEEGAEVDPDAVREDYDQDMLEFMKETSTDSRVCLRATAPRPVTALAITIDLK